VRNLLAAEALKLRTVKVTWALLAATIAISLLAVTGAILAENGGASPDLESERGVRMVLNVSATGAIIVLVLGVIISSGEFRQRTATETFLITPRRWRVIAAKLTASIAVGAAFGALSTGAAIVAADQIYWVTGYAFPFASSNVWSIFGGAVLFSALFGGLGAATGSLVRNQVAAIVGWLVWLSLVEHIASQLIPGLARWFPAAAGMALMRAPNDDLLSRPVAGLILGLYAAAIMGLAVVSERYRDA
jgi:ABC-type transport system involved in multi-copper enzyme maturation permease subunit